MFRKTFYYAKSVIPSWLHSHIFFASKYLRLKSLSKKFLNVIFFFNSWFRFYLKAINSFTTKDGHF